MFQAVPTLQDPSAEAEAEALIKKYQRYLFQIARMYIRNPEEVEDVVQEASIRIWRSWLKSKLVFEDERRLMTWFKKIVTHLCIDFVRAGRHRERILDPEGAEIHKYLKHLSGREPKTPAEILIQEEDSTPVWSLAQNLLSPRQFQVLELMSKDGLSSKEMAKRFSICEGAVKVHIYRMRLKMKPVLS